MRIPGLYDFTEECGKTPERSREIEPLAASRGALRKIASGWIWCTSVSYWGQGIHGTIRNTLDLVIFPPGGQNGNVGGE
jgi:hypothetical protein